MKIRKRGAIINIASIAAFEVQPYVTMYSATKAYIDFFSRGLSYEYSDKGIRCILIRFALSSLVLGSNLDKMELMSFSHGFQEE